LAVLVGLAAIVIPAKAGGEDPESLADRFNRAAAAAEDDCQTLSQPELIGMVRTDEVEIGSMTPGEELSLSTPIKVGEEVMIYAAIAFPPNPEGDAPLEIKWKLNGAPSPARSVVIHPKWGSMVDCDSRLAIALTFTHDQSSVWTLMLVRGDHVLTEQDFHVVR
jgi:hypothetical protein